MASDWARKKATLLREEIWSAYETACEAERAEGCEHTPDGDPLICWSCRERKFELVARIAAALDEARAEVRRLREEHAVCVKINPECDSCLQSEERYEKLLHSHTRLLKEMFLQRERWVLLKQVPDDPADQAACAIRNLDAAVAEAGPCDGE